MNILLSCCFFFSFCFNNFPTLLQIIGNDYRAEDLGPGTIVGSAAFNMLMIIAICVSITPSKVRLPLTLSLFAYNIRNLISLSPYSPFPIFF